ncbi:MAG TPA: hypothetical protein VJB09_02825 [Candidatus Paceibacterota bacterium]
MKQAKQKGFLIVWFILVVIGLWFLWYWTGGPQRYEAYGGGPFLKPPKPLNTGESYW